MLIRKQCTLDNASGLLHVHADRLVFSSHEATAAVQIPVGIITEYHALGRHTLCLLAEWPARQWQCSACLEWFVFDSDDTACSVCGSRRATWTCDVCEHGNSECVPKCLECGCTRCDAEDGGGALARVHELRFASKDDLDLVVGTLKALAGQQGRAPPPQGLGVSGLMLGEEVKQLERQFAVSSLDGDMRHLEQCMHQLMQLAASFGSSGHGGIFEELGMSPGIYWDEQDLPDILSSFVSEQVFGSLECKAITLSDLYCLFNRAAASVVAPDTFRKALGSVIYLKSGIAVCLSPSFDLRVREDGLDADQIAEEWGGVATFLARELLDEQVLAGILVVDRGPFVDRYFKNAFL